MIKTDNKIETNKTFDMFIGLDLSFNSSGITLIESIDKSATIIEFHRMIFNPTDKKINPLSTINQHSYTLPHNLNYKRLTMLDLVSDLSFDLADGSFIDVDDKLYNDTLLIENYNLDQLYITTKLMINAKRIFILIDDFINKVKTRNGINESQINLIFNVEGNILGGNTAHGNSQLRVIGGLIMLQQEVRNRIIQYSLSGLFKDIKLFITSPTELKMYFTDNGNSDKLDMIIAFNKQWNGKKLIPESERVVEINDVVDSFALAVLAYEKFNYPSEYMSWLGSRSPSRLKKKTRKKKVKMEKPQFDILSDAISMI